MIFLSKNNCSAGSVELEQIEKMCGYNSHLHEVKINIWGENGQFAGFSLLAAWIEMALEDLI